MQKIQFIQVTPEQLQNEITKGIKSHLDEFLENFKPTQAKEYLTRKEVANMFSVDISTIHNWCKSGKLNPLAKGNRIYFLRTEVENSLVQINKQS
jgi:ATP-dependent exoDNAse (exonuclease V) beta subunit